MARDERIFKSPIVLEVCQITAVIYTQLRNNRITIKSNVRLDENNMNSACQHPWQRGPAELLDFAIKTAQSTIHINQLVSFLLLDVCVETTMRTYLSLPDGLIETDMRYIERRKYAEGNFHELTRGVEASAKSRIGDRDLHYAKFFHALRNQLYHQGSGVTVNPEDVRGYASIAGSLLKHLLAVERTDIWEAPVGETTQVSQESFLTLKSELGKNLRRYRELIEQLFETLEPKLVYPTTIKRLSDIAANIEATSFPQKLRDMRQLLNNTIKDNEIRLWILNLLSDDIEGDDQQVLKNSQFLMELGIDHISLYSLIVGMFFLPLGDVRKDSVDRYEDISFLADDEYSILGIYDACSFFETHILSVPSLRPEILGAAERGLELNKKLAATIKRIESLMQA
jgi:hypothetical protein